MPKFKVIGQASYEYEVEAEDEDMAIFKALDLFHEAISGITYWEDVLEWEAHPAEAIAIAIAKGG